jgi:hypothetical protein
MDHASAHPPRWTRLKRPAAGARTIAFPLWPAHAVRPLWRRSSRAASRRTRSGAGRALGRRSTRFLACDRRTSAIVPNTVVALTGRSRLGLVPGATCAHQFSGVVRSHGLRSSKGREGEGRTVLVGGRFGSLDGRDRHLARVEEEFVGRLGDTAVGRPGDRSAASL